MPCRFTSFFFVGKWCTISGVCTKPAISQAKGTEEVGKAVFLTLACTEMVLVVGVFSCLGFASFTQTEYNRHCGGTHDAVCRVNSLEE